jgi:hypothetical protein
MCLGRNGKTHRIDAPDEFSPIRGPLSAALLANTPRGFFIKIAHAHKLRSTFSRERRVNARVLAAETANPNDCCT